MPTISQLPAAVAISASDLVPISQGGSVHAISVGALLAQTQPAIMVAPPSILGRFSLGTGGPDTIAVGSGLTFNNGTLCSSEFDLTSLPLQVSLDPDDQIIVTNTGTSQLLELTQIRGLFTAGSNISIDTNGVISSSTLNGVTTYSLTALASVTAIASTDLVGISHAGQDHTITYGNFLDGMSIDEALPAAAASDSDTFWVAQANNVMLRQTFSALWPWFAGKLPSWTRSVIELNGNTTLAAATHNNAILVCSSPISISALTANLEPGFSCELINASSGQVAFSSNILTSNGSNGLSPGQCGVVICVTYSAGTKIFASISAGSLATAVPGPASGLAASSVTSTSMTISWSAPTSGGTVSIYSVQYRVTGSTPWLVAGQTSGALSLAVSSLQASTSYDFSVGTTNNIGDGPISTTLAVITLANGTVPGTPTAVTLTNVTSSGMTCSWTAPANAPTGTVYNVQFRVTGQNTWGTAASNLAATTVSINSLTPETSYDVQVTASASNGSGPPSTIVSAVTASSSGLVTSITWNTIPSGSYVHGSGTIAVNAHVNPGTATIQFGFSTSPTTAPISWLVSTFVNTDLWGQYMPTPATAGTWYVWAEGTDGSAISVYSTPFTVT
jgi:hypothetical protein